MSIYKFSTNDGEVKGKVRANNEEQAAKKAFVSISKKLKGSTQNNDYLNKDHHFSIKNSEYVGTIKK